MEPDPSPRQRPASASPQGYQPKLGRKLFMMSLSLFGLIAVWVFYWIASKQQVQDKPPPTSGPSVLVLPFAGESPAKDDDYFALGWTSELRAALTRVNGLRVVAYSFPQVREGAREMGQRFQTSAVLEGSALKSGDHLHITAQLTDSTTGFHLWSKTYDRDWKDIFSLEDEIARAIVNSLRVAVKVDPNRLLASPAPRNLAAYDSYLHGRANTSTNSIEYFEQAVQADPNFAAAFAALSNAYAMEGYYRAASGLEAFRKAKSAAEKALEIDNTLAEAHSSLGFALAFGDWNWPASDREFRRALELDPGSAGVHDCYAIAYLAPTGHLDIARTEIKLGLDLDPMGFFPNYASGWIFLVSRQNEAAVEQYRHALDLNSSSADAWRDYGMAFALAGKPHQALDQFEHAGKMKDGKAWSPGVMELALVGRLDEARKVRPAGSSVDKARAFALIGDKDAAFDALSKALAEHEPELIWLKVDPRFDNLRRDARLSPMLKRIGLEP